MNFMFRKNNFGRSRNTLEDQENQEEEFILLIMLNPTQMFPSRKLLTLAPIAPWAQLYFGTYYKEPSSSVYK